MNNCIKIGGGGKLEEPLKKIWEKIRGSDPPMLISRIQVYPYYYCVLIILNLIFDRIA